MCHLFQESVLSEPELKNLREWFNTAIQVVTDTVLINQLFGYPGSDGHSHCLEIQVVTDSVLINQLFAYPGSDGYSYDQSAVWLSR